MSDTMNAVVTGATSGIGEAIARNLAAAGMRVVLVGRSTRRLDEAGARIRAAVPDADLLAEQADLALLGEVRALAGRLAEAPPDIVVSNAAVVADPDDRTPEGHQRTLAVNHLAPYVLLRSLIEPIGDRPARFVIVGASPRALAPMPVDLDDLECRDLRALGRLPSLRPATAYARTKNMNAMLVYALARRLKHTRITVNGAHPGIIRGTRLGEGTMRGALRAFAAASALVSPGGPDVGADTPTWLATDPALASTTGRFYVKRTPVPTAPHTTDPERCDRLWERTAQLTGMPE
ncbi:SDR family NAD(P)-dependent oxidoreductase [Glycomyces artemisiae]|uniref:NAD(P)-dependent dehydrogenase (Short-subunit alcohol dehydrogenase family) n=1 Tax=Glycomyces artemisiae TaxID=1076443 RepID=A0A2T0URM7_9ACTN|nr:SDR family NAD(P)-dependent oxidoreductase [Glycomyces artemisiae]PRY60560.1 NAD(P)-dependent dehydrogenase (short-subunit alcohol dehydrogenase family) [Glycomyces artemisiae]